MLFNPLPLYANFRLFQFNGKLWYNVNNIDKWGYNYLMEMKTLWEKEKLLVTSNFSSSHNVFKSCLLLMCQNEYLWSKGLKLCTTRFRLSTTLKKKLLKTLWKKEKMLVTSISHNVLNHQKKKFCT